MVYIKPGSVSGSYSELSDLLRVVLRRTVVGDGCFYNVNLSDSHLQRQLTETITLDKQQGCP